MAAAGTCWVWTKLVDVCGDLESVPVVYGKEQDEQDDDEPTEPDDDSPLHPTKEPTVGPTTS